MRADVAEMNLAKFMLMIFRILPPLSSSRREEREPMAKKTARARPFSDPSRDPRRSIFAVELNDTLVRIAPVPAERKVRAVIR